MVKVAGLTISWSNDGSGVSSTRKHIWPNTTISEKQGRLLGNTCIHTTLNVVIQHSIIRHRHPAIIQSCYCMIMQPKGGFSPLLSYIYQFIIKCLDFCLDNWTTIYGTQGLLDWESSRWGWQKRNYLWSEPELLLHDRRKKCITGLSGTLCCCENPSGKQRIVKGRDESLKLPTQN